MIDSIDDAIDVIRGPLHTVVHVGAGAGGQVALYRRLGAERVVLIEPNPAFARTPVEADDDLDVDRVAVAIAPGGTTQTLLKIANFPSFSSLLPYQRLPEFFPNVGVRDEVEVETVALPRLLEGLRLSSGSHALVLELQGLETDVLAETGAEQLAPFDWIVVRTSEEDLYAARSRARPASLGDHLERLGFVALRMSEAAPPFVVWVGVRNPLGTALQGMETAYAAAVAEGAELNAKLANLDAEREAAAQKESSALARRIEQLLAVNARLEVDATTAFDRAQAEVAGVRDAARELEERNTELVSRLADRDSSIRELTAGSVGLQARLDELESNREEANAELGSALAARDATIRELTTGSVGLQARLEDLESNRQRLVEESTSAIERLNVELAGVREALGAATSDLSELRAGLAEREASINGLSAELEAARQDARELATENGELRVRVEDKSSQVEQARREVEAVTNALRDAGVDLDQSRAELSSLRNALQAAELRSQKLELSLDESQNARVEHSASLQALRLELADARDTVARLEGELHAIANAPPVVTAAELEELRAARERERATRDELETQARSFESEMASKRKEVEDLRAEAASKRKEISDLEDQIREMAFRQQLLDREVLRAEAQIEFIGDVLIRERQF